MVWVVSWLLYYLFFAYLLWTDAPMLVIYFALVPIVLGLIWTNIQVD